MKQKEHITGFVQEIWSWYARHKRILPWRDIWSESQDQRAYMVMVSEVMLQQTQVSRVIHVYKRFLEQFPTIGDLGQASNKDMILAWRGMGYNRRSLMLRDGARYLIERRSGKRGAVSEELFPKTMEELMKIAGVGPYTSAAIRNFAFNIPTPCLDTNIRRILHRVFVGPENLDGTWKQDDAYLLVLASSVLKEVLRSGERRCPAVTGVLPGLAVSGKIAAEWHAALMDFGSLVQTKNNPKWDICPLTAKGLMKATSSSSPCGRDKRRGDFKKRREPGRTVGSKYIPNRIFRGRIIEELRDSIKGLRAEEIGRRVCLDWQTQLHAEWLDAILQKLQSESFIKRSKDKYVLQG
jgi:A/G-specific adenine glycosylase